MLRPPLNEYHLPITTPILWSYWTELPCRICSFASMKYVESLVRWNELKLMKLTIGELPDSCIAYMLQSSATNLKNPDLLRSEFLWGKRQWSLACDSRRRWPCARQPVLWRDDEWHQLSKKASNVSDKTYRADLLCSLFNDSCLSMGFLDFIM